MPLRLTKKNNALFVVCSHVGRTATPRLGGAPVLQADVAHLLCARSKLPPRYSERVLEEEDELNTVT